MPLEFDADDQELELFLAENNDHLQLLDQNIVRLEANPRDQQLLQSIFRSAHTIKGGAGLIGHQRMAELAHSMENVLDELRAQTLTVTPATIDALLASLDVLRVLNHEVITRLPSDIALEGVLAALAACLTPDAAPVDGPEAAEQSEIAAPAGSAMAEPVSPPAGYATADLAAWAPDDELERLLAGVDPAQVYEITLCIDPECGLSAARTMQAYLELRRTTRLLRATPTLGEIEADEEINALRALVVSEELPSLLEHRLARMADVTEARVTAVSLPVKKATSRGAKSAAKGSATKGSPARATAPAAPPAAARGATPALAAAPRVQTPAEKVAPETIRISVSILDDLMSLVSELVLGRTRLQTLRAQLQQRYRDDESVANLEDAVGHLDRVSSDLQTTVMKARMLPVENVFNKFPRLMRDLAAQSGKQVSFAMNGQETELDRSVIEQLSDPLIHLLRNAIDHGLETPAQRAAAGKPAAGSITLSATPHENHILIEVRDDGRGIDGAAVKAKAVAKGILSTEAAERLSEREASELIFAPGLSTAREITDISGRGVGMDIVKSTIERMGGHIQIESAPGEGTTFSITLPLTLAIMQALLVSVDDAVYALPLNMVTEIVSVAPEQIHMLQGTEATLLRGAILPIVRLRDYFGCSPAPRSADLHVVATRVDGQLLGLAVDHFIGEQEIVMKPLGAYMGAITGLAGATILGDGRIGLLVDIAALKDWTPELTRAA